MPCLFSLPACFYTLLWKMHKQILTCLWYQPGTSLPQHLLPTHTPTPNTFPSRWHLHHLSQSYHCGHFLKRYTSHPSHSLQPTVESYLPWNTPCWQLDFRINTSSPSLTSWAVASVNEVCLWNLSSTAKINLSSTTKMKNKTLSQLFFICWPEIGARSRDNLIKQYLWLICHFSSEHCKCQ